MHEGGASRGFEPYSVVTAIGDAALLALGDSRKVAPLGRAVVVADAEAALVDGRFDAQARAIESIDRRRVEV